jgi:hypothetical protein
MASIPSSAPAAPPLLVIAWSLGAGFFLLLAPAIPALWDRVAAGESPLRQLAAIAVVRLAVSSLGLLLLMIGSWDLATALVGRWAR